MKVPSKARTQAKPPAPQGESTTWASVGQTVSPATDFHHRLLKNNPGNAPPRVTGRTRWHRMQAECAWDHA